MADFSDCALVVVAAGKGSRFGGYKQLVPLLDRPLLVQTLHAFASVGFAERLVVLPSDFLLQGTWDRLMENDPHLRAYRAIAGGEERHRSVLEGVLAVAPGIRFVAVHDGARPLPPLDALLECVRLLRRDPETRAAIVAAPVTDTIKRIAPGGAGHTIAHTEDRSQLVRAETPQVCDREALLAALSVPHAQDPRDEAEALERSGHRTAFVLHQGYNPKITHAKDIAVVAAYLGAKDETTPTPRAITR